METVLNRSLNSNALMLPKETIQKFTTILLSAFTKDDEDISVDVFIEALKMHEDYRCAFKFRPLDFLNPPKYTLDLVTKNVMFLKANSARIFWILAYIGGSIACGIVRTIEYRDFPMKVTREKRYLTVFVEFGLKNKQSYRCKLRARPV